jgi:hypothetical protein
MAEIVQNEEKNRFELIIDGEVAGFSTYQLIGNDIIFVHTEVDPKRQERGLGSTLVQGELDQVRTGTSLRVVAQCPFVAHFVREHAEYEDLLSR